MGDGNPSRANQRSQVRRLSCARSARADTVGPSPGACNVTSSASRSGSGSSGRAAPSGARWARRRSGGRARDGFPPGRGPGGPRRSRGRGWCRPPGGARGSVAGGERSPSSVARRPTSDLQLPSRSAGSGSKSLRGPNSWPEPIRSLRVRRREAETIARPARRPKSGLVAKAPLNVAKRTYSRPTRQRSLAPTPEIAPSQRTAPCLIPARLRSPPSSSPPWSPPPVRPTRPPRSPASAAKAKARIATRGARPSARTKR